MRVKGGYGLPILVGILLLVVAFLPSIRRTFARVFPEGFIDAANCRGVTCKEGEFCQDNVCRPVEAPKSGEPKGSSLYNDF